MYARSTGHVPRNQTQALEQAALGRGRGRGHPAHVVVAGQGVPARVNYRDLSQWRGHNIRTMHLTDIRGLLEARLLQLNAPVPLRRVLAEQAFNVMLAVADVLDIDNIATLLSDYDYMLQSLFDRRDLTLLDRVGFVRILTPIHNQHVARVSDVVTITPGFGPTGRGSVMHTTGRQGVRIGTPARQGGPNVVHGTPARQGPNVVHGTPARQGPNVVHGTPARQGPNVVHGTLARQGSNRGHGGPVIAGNRR